MSEVVGDRISNLPASLLLHILSFVDTTDSARTGVLSKRWKYIWRSIPILQFGCQNSSQTDTFMDFVDRTLELHDDSNIQESSLVSSVLLSDSRIQKWITTVINHNVEVLILGLNQRDLIFILQSFYTSESLITLKLLSKPGICFPKYISFPRIQTLLLCQI